MGASLFYCKRLTTAKIRHQGTLSSVRIPENASFRYVVKTEVIEKSDEQIATFPRGSQQKDFEEFVGLETYMNKNNTNIIGDAIGFFFNVNSKTPVNNGNFDGGCAYSWYK